MPETNWNLLQVPDIGQAFRQGQEMRRQYDTRSALAAYATNPNEQNLTALAQYEPAFVIQQRQAMAKAQQDKQAAQMRQLAAKGDPAALEQLMGIDFDGWKAIDANRRQLVKAQNDYTGQAALRISQIQDPAEQAIAWDQAIDQGVQMGFTGLADHKGKFSPQALNAAIDNAGLVDKFISLAEPKYMAIPEGGTLVNTRSPEAVAGFASSQPKQIGSKAEYDALAPGSEYIAPDGSVKRKGGASSNASGGFPASRVGG